MAEVPATLLWMPEEVIVHVGRACLGHLPSAVRLATQTCKSLSTSLQPMLAQARARRLQWLPSHTIRHKITHGGRTLTKTHANGHDCACAAGPLLPITGKSAWRVRIEESCADGNDLTNTCYIGVCDVSARSEWGLDIGEGKLVHLKRNHKGQIVELGDNRSSRPLGESVCLRGHATGAIIEVIIDHDQGALSFAIDGGPASAPVIISSVIVDAVAERDGRRGNGSVVAIMQAEGHEPARGVALRPYASLGLARSARPDCVSFCDGYVYNPSD